MGPDAGQHGRRAQLQERNGISRLPDVQGA